MGLEHLATTQLFSHNTNISLLSCRSWPTAFPSQHGALPRPRRSRTNSPRISQWRGPLSSPNFKSQTWTVAVSYPAPSRNGGRQHRCRDRMGVLESSDYCSVSFVEWHGRPHGKEGPWRPRVIVLVQTEPIQLVRSTQTPRVSYDSCAFSARYFLGDDGVEYRWKHFKGIGTVVRLPCCSAVLA